MINEAILPGNAESEIDAYGPIRSLLLPEHADRPSHELKVLLGPIPATIVLHQLLRGPDVRQVLLAVLAGGSYPRVRYNGQVVPAPRLLRLLSRLCHEVAENMEAEVTSGLGRERDNGSHGFMQSEAPGEDREFRPDQLPAKARLQFGKTSNAAWKYAVGEAIGAGIRDPKVLADIIFFMQHRDRIDARGIAKLIDEKEPEFVKLHAEWELYQTIARRRLDPKYDCSPFLAPVVTEDYERYVNPPTTGRISLLINGKSGPKVQLEAFDQMQQSVMSLTRGDSMYLAAFMFNTTNLTTPVAGLATWNDLLVKKAGEGVRIRILLTDVPKPGPNWGSNLSPLQQLLEKLPEAAHDNLKWVVSPHPATVHAIVNLRAKNFTIMPTGGALFGVGTHHQKFMVVRRGHETTAFCGGLDISPERVPRSPFSFVWHDTHAKLEGKIARDLEREFVLRWNREKDKSTAAPLTHWKPLENLVTSRSEDADGAMAKNQTRMQLLRTVSIGPAPGDIRRDDVWQAYFRIIGCATRFLIMENQYFHEPVMADAIVRQTEAQPGLIVLIVVSGETDDPDNFLTDNGRAQQNELITRLLGNVPSDRVRVYSMRGRLVHSKLIMADDQFLSMGSTNADPRDFFMDTQLNVVLRDPEVVTRFRQRQWAHNLGLPATSVADWKAAEFFSNWDAVAKANQSRADVASMQGEAIVPFDPRTVKGKRDRSLDMLTEVPASETTWFRG